MKKIVAVISIMVIIFVLFKLNTPKPGEYLVKINNYSMTPHEFNAEFLASAYAKDNTPESRKEFLDILIRRKLVIQYAQDVGLDKDKEFLKSIERFWEQSLLKLVMDKKSQEITGSAAIPDSAVQEVYNKLISEGKTDKPYDQMYSQIKWSLAQRQESEAINKWLASLYDKAEVKVNSKYFPKN